MAGQTFNGNLCSANKRHQREYRPLFACTHWTFKTDRFFKNCFHFKIICRKGGGPILIIRQKQSSSGLWFWFLVEQWNMRLIELWARFASLRHHRRAIWDRTKRCRIQILCISDFQWLSILGIIITFFVDCSSSASRLCSAPSSVCLALCDGGSSTTLNRQEDANFISGHRGVQRSLSFFQKFYGHAVKFTV